MNVFALSTMTLLSNLSVRFTFYAVGTLLLITSFLTATFISAYYLVELRNNPLAVCNSMFFAALVPRVLLYTVPLSSLITIRLIGTYLFSEHIVLILHSFERLKKNIFSLLLIGGIGIVVCTGINSFYFAPQYYRRAQEILARNSLQQLVKFAKQSHGTVITISEQLSFAATQDTDSSQLRTIQLLGKKYAFLARCGTVGDNELILKDGAFVPLGRSDGAISFFEKLVVPGTALLKPDKMYSLFRGRSSQKKSVENNSLITTGAFTLWFAFLLLLFFCTLDRSTRKSSFSWGQLLLLVSSYVSLYTTSAFVTTCTKLAFFSSVTCLLAVIVVRCKRYYYAHLL